MRQMKFTRRDILKTIGLILALSLAAGIVGPTISYNLGIAFESELSRIIGHIAMGVVVLTVGLWTTSRFYKVSLIHAILMTVVITVVIVTSIFLFVLR